SVVSEGTSVYRLALHNLWSRDTNGSFCRSRHLRRGFFLQDSPLLTGSACLTSGEALTLPLDLREDVHRQAGRLRASQKQRQVNVRKRDDEGEDRARDQARPQQPLFCS